MRLASEQVLLQEHLDETVVFGDTNSMLASTPVTAKLHISNVHRENYQQCTYLL
jgi:UDP-N-acetylglucosamine 2-epimerase